MGVVIVIRDPDSSNEFVTFGVEARIIDVDFGRADLSDVEEFSDWAEGHSMEAATLRLMGEVEAAAYLSGLIEEARDNFGHA